MEKGLGARELLAESMDLALKENWYLLAGGEKRGQRAKCGRH